MGVLKVPNYISNFVLISALTIFITLILNFKIKVSAHMAGIGAFLSFFYTFFTNEYVSETLFSPLNINITIISFFSIIVIIAGIIASSRLILKAHTMKEILIGFFIGVLLGLLNFIL
ncbi:MAG: hypothetical protein GXO49_02495 [Chlorobi bacterium]|nr:hypothetical protein [Chlorobiota bacterium]